MAKRTKIEIPVEKIEKTKRKIIREKVNGVYVDGSDFEGSFDQIYSALSCSESLAAKKGYTNLAVVNDRDADGYDNFYVNGDREETLVEVRRRLEIAAMRKIDNAVAKDARDARDLKELERLAKKHGKKLVEKE